MPDLLFIHSYPDDRAKVAIALALFGTASQRSMHGAAYKRVLLFKRAGDRFGKLKYCESTYMPSVLCACLLSMLSAYACMWTESKRALIYSQALAAAASLHLKRI